jgi:type VI secretion system secreted protein VgrG
VGGSARGLSLIASKEPVRYEAQSNEIKVQAKQLINIQSANSHIDWAAAKKISISTADGANITIEGGNITVQCPGKLTVHASSKKFDGPANLSYPLPVMPTSETKPIKFAFCIQDIPGPQGHPISGQNWSVVRTRERSESGYIYHPVDRDSWVETFAEGSTGADGEIKLTDEDSKGVWDAVNLYPSKVFLVFGLDAIPLQKSSFTSGEGRKEIIDTLDANNYIKSLSTLPCEKDIDEIKRKVEYDFQSSIYSSAKQKTKI